MKGGDTMYYAFILNMWIMAKITTEQVQAFVPKYINQDEADMILLTPQTPGTLSVVATV